MVSSTDSEKSTMSETSRPMAGQRQTSVGGRPTPLVIRSAIVAALGGLLFGFDTAVISGATEALTREWSLSAGELGFTVSSALLGTFIGAIVGARPADKYGRKPVLIAIALMYLVSAVGTALATDWYFFLVLRMLGGIAVGASSVIAPLYTAEISPPRYRGRLVAMVQFNIVIGIVVAYLSNWLVVRTITDDTAWRWMLGLEALPATLFMVLLFTIPESPRWLYTRGRRSEARAVLVRLSGPVEAERTETEIRRALEQRSARTSAAKFFAKGNYRRIGLAVAIAVFSQVAGTNAILYYAPSLLGTAGIEGDGPFLASIFVGITNVVFTALGMALIDRIGRRPLVTIGASIDLAALLFVASVFYFNDGALSPTTGIAVLIAIMFFIAGLAMGIGSVLWVFIAEIFPIEHRAKGQSVGALSHWLASAAVSGFFPVMSQISMTATFLFYAGCMAALLVWARKVMPETKGVALEDV